jgi:hypothetical protein
MRSTWVIIIRRQQYRCSCSVSMASLIVSSVPTQTSRSNFVPVGHVLLFNELQVALPEVANDLYDIQLDWWQDTTAKRTFPQEKHRTGIIMVWFESGDDIFRVVLAAHQRFEERIFFLASPGRCLGSDIFQRLQFNISVSFGVEEWFQWKSLV